MLVARRKAQLYRIALLVVLCYSLARLCMEVALGPASAKLSARLCERACVENTNTSCTCLQQLEQGANASHYLLKLHAQSSLVHLLHSPDADATDNAWLLLFVLSTSSRRWRRDFVRRTWGAKASHVGVQVVFLLGTDKQAHSQGGQAGTQLFGDKQSSK